MLTLVCPSQPSIVTPLPSFPRSEIYESVPPGCDAFGGSLGDDLDEPLSPSLGGVYGGDELYPPRHPAHYPQPHYVGGQYRGGGPPSGVVGGSLGSSTQQLTPSDDSDIYSHIDNDDDEQQLVKPSQIKKQRRFQQGTFLRLIFTAFNSITKKVTLCVLTAPILTLRTLFRVLLSIQSLSVIDLNCRRT